MGLKVIDVVVWYTNNDNVLMMMTSQRTRSVGKREKWGRGPKKNRLAKYRRSGDFGGSRRRSQNVEGGPKQRFDVSRPGPAKFLYADRAKLCNNDRT